MEHLGVFGIGRTRDRSIARAIPQIACVLQGQEGCESVRDRSLPRGRGVEGVGEGGDIGTAIGPGWSGRERTQAARLVGNPPGAAWYVARRVLDLGNGGAPCAARRIEIDTAQAQERACDRGVIAFGCGDRGIRVDDDVSADSIAGSACDDLVETWIGSAG